MWVSHYQFRIKSSNFAPDLVRGGSVKSWHEAMRHAEKPV